MFGKELRDGIRSRRGCIATFDGDGKDEKKLGDDRCVVETLGDNKHVCSYCGLVIYPTFGFVQHGVMHDTSILLNTNANK